MNFDIYFNAYKEKLTLIKIPYDARIYVEEDKLKSDKLN